VTYTSIRLNNDIHQELATYCMLLAESVAEFPHRYPDFLTRRQPPGLGEAVRWLLHQARNARVRQHRAKYRKRAKKEAAVILTTQDGKTTVYPRLYEDKDGQTGPQTSS
jgi:hypothetical protein